MKRVFLLCISFIFISCQTNSKKEISLPDVNPSTIGNVRLAIIGTFKKNNLLLVNKSNTKYLKPKSFAKKEKRSELKLSSLEYLAPDLPFNANTAVVILDDDVMAKLIALMKKYRFNNYAVSSKQNDILSSEWPERATILYDNNGKLFSLTRDSQLVISQSKTIKPKSQTYRIIKQYIILAQQTGYKPVQQLRGMSGKNYFRRNQRVLRRDNKNIKNKTNKESTTPN